MSPLSSFALAGYIDCVSPAPSPPMHTASGKDMRKSGDNETQGWVIDTQVWVEAWRRMYPTKAALNVARDLDAPSRTVEKWFSGEAKPSFDYWGKILNRYGLGFVVSGMAAPVAHLDDLAREERRARLIAERRDIDALLAEDWERRALR